MRFLDEFLALRENQIMTYHYVMDGLFVSQDVSWEGKQRSLALRCFFSSPRFANFRSVTRSDSFARRFLEIDAMRRIRGGYFSSSMLIESYMNRTRIEWSWNFRGNLNSFVSRAKHASTTRGICDLT